jgi:cytochrome P450
MAPSVAAPTWRTADEGGIIIDGEFFVQGTNITTCPYSIFRNPKYFPDPLQYNPDRWILSESTPATQVELAKKAFAPFSMGSRMCLGKNLALTELMLTMAHLVWTTDFKKVDGVDGSIGGGNPKVGRGRERTGEYQLWTQLVTVTNDGPILQFRRR